MLPIIPATRYTRAVYARLSREGFALAIVAGSIWVPRALHVMGFTMTEGFFSYSHNGAR